MSSPPAMMSYDYPHPVSRTYQYKKITKPLLERKRRARINRCLDELKDLMVDAFETEGENISKLEKADILELTVRHLQKLQTSRPAELSTTTTATATATVTTTVTTTTTATIADGDEISAESRWQSGFGHCATEACRFLSTLPGEAAERLARHLAAGLQTSRRTNSSPTKPGSLLSCTPANLDVSITNVMATRPNLVGTSGKIDSAIPATGTTPIRRSTSRANETAGKKTTVSRTSRYGGASSLPPLVNVNEKLTASCSAKPRSQTDIRQSTIATAMARVATATTTTTTTTTRNITNDPQVVSYVEEINAEHVNEHNPMWRPW